MRTAVTARFGWWLKRAAGVVFDFVHRVDTSADRPVLSGDIVSPNRNKAVPYDPAPWRTLPRSLRLGSLRANGFTFIDIGCGKGKVLLSALAFSFKRIIGVEFSPSLCEIAKNNLSTARLMRRECDIVQVNCSDAVDFCVPNEPAIFFFYNPFTYDVMEIVLSNILDAHLRRPCPRYLIFYAASSSISKIKSFFQSNAEGHARLLVASQLGKRSVYIFELVYRG